MHVEIYMFTSILDVVYARQEFLGLKLEWSPTETIVNTYCKMLFECSFTGVIVWLSDHFFTLVYKMIFEWDPPYMSTETMEALIDIADWYASPFDTFIRMYSAKKPSHVLPMFALDVLVMQEVAYHISARLTATLHQKKKAPWLVVLLCIRLYDIWSFKHADVKVEVMKKYPFDP